MFKKMLALLTVLCLVLSFAACVKDNADTPTTEAGTQDVTDSAVLGEDDFAWYVSAGAGMGATLNMASEKQAYALTDKATFLANEANLDLEILLEKGDDMKNTYSLIAVNADAFDESVGINTQGANDLIDWMLSSDALSLIAVYGTDNYGQNLFTVDEAYADLVTDTLPEKEQDAVEEPENNVIRLSTTTSVNDSGLLPYLMEYFEAATGYTVEIASAGTGAAISAAEKGEADLLLVHAKASEEEFINKGFGVKRIPFMYNFFVVVGPENDPAQIADCENAGQAFRKIAEAKSEFISRGDNSGTHKAELKIWKAIEIAVPTAE